jgi:hypothetical protein
MFQTKVLDKIKTHILYSVPFFRKSCPFWDNVEKYGTARQATDGNIIRRMRFAWWITKATDTHSEYVILIAFSTGTVDTRTRLNITFIGKLPVSYQSMFAGGQILDRKPLPSLFAVLDDLVHLSGAAERQRLRTAQTPMLEYTILDEVDQHSGTHKSGPLLQKKSIIRLSGGSFCDLTACHVFNLLKPSGNFTYHQV